MGRASSRPRSRRASGRACFASTDAFVDVAGITAERAAEGSGSEWSSEEKEEEKETEVVPPGPRPEGVVGVDADAPLSNVPAPPTPASIRAATRRATRRASRPPPPPGGVSRFERNTRTCGARLPVHEREGPRDGAPRDRAPRGGAGLAARPPRRSGSDPSRSGSRATPARGLPGTYE